MWQHTHHKFDTEQDYSLALKELGWYQSALPFGVALDPVGTIWKHTGEYTMQDDQAQPVMELTPGFHVNAAWMNFSMPLVFSNTQIIVNTPSRVWAG